MSVAQLVKLGQQVQRVHRVQLEQTLLFLGQPVQQVQQDHKVQRVQIQQCPDHKGQQVHKVLQVLIQPFQGHKVQPVQILLLLVLQVPPVQRGRRVQPEHLQHSRRQYKTKLPITQFRQQTNLR